MSGPPLIQVAVARDTVPDRTLGGGQARSSGLSATFWRQVAMDGSFLRDRRRRLSAVLGAFVVLAAVSAGSADTAQVSAAAPTPSPRHASVAHLPATALRPLPGTAPRPVVAHQASSAITRARHPKLVSAPVTHPNDDFLGSTIEAHEGKHSPPVTPPHPGATLPGLDVSHHQGTVNWGSVAAGGATFAYLKATEGTGFVDGQFHRNVAGSRAAGLFRGAYHFALPDRSGGAAQANFFVDHGGGWTADSATLPPVIDMEYNPYGPTCYGLDQAQMSAWVMDFSVTVHNRTRRWPMIYTTRDWWSRCAGDAAVAHTDPLWLARYNSDPGALPAGWSFYAVWQYDDAGTFPGDQDVFSGTIQQLSAFAGGGRPVVLHNPPPSGPTAALSRPAAARPATTSVAPQPTPLPTTTPPPATTTEPPAPPTTEPPTTTTTTAPPPTSEPPATTTDPAPTTTTEPPTSTAGSAVTTTEPPTTTADPSTTATDGGTPG
ncbi:MAG TPA: lysozyme [Pseudonocardiaceae bacterium]|nr:lysozyme [Pseudonocardiaceae bacterium]